MRSVFFESYDFIKAEKERQVNKRAHIKVPDGIREFPAIYSTDDQ
jgi:hypothetical protein